MAAQLHTCRLISNRAHLSTTAVFQGGLISFFSPFVSLTLEGVSPIPQPWRGKGFLPMVGGLQCLTISCLSLEHTSIHCPHNLQFKPQGMSSSSFSLTQP